MLDVAVLVVLESDQTCGSVHCYDLTASFFVSFRFSLLLFCLVVQIHLFPAFEVVRTESYYVVLLSFSPSLFQFRVPNNRSFLVTSWFRGNFRIWEEQKSLLRRRPLDCCLVVLIVSRSSMYYVFIIVSCSSFEYSHEARHRQPFRVLSRALLCEN